MGWARRAGRRLVPDDFLRLHAERFCIHGTSYRNDAWLWLLSTPWYLGQHHDDQQGGEAELPCGLDSLSYHGGLSSIIHPLEYCVRLYLSDVACCSYSRFPW